MTKTIELKSQAELDEWLSAQGDRIRVINVATATKKWSVMTGFFTNAKTYTVIYEELARPKGRLTSHRIRSRAGWSRADRAVAFGSREA